MVKMAHGENDFKRDRTFGINHKKEEYFRLYFCRKRSLINIILVKKNYFVQRFLKYEDATWIIVETTVTSERAPNSMLEFSHMGKSPYRLSRHISAYINKTTALFSILDRENKYCSFV